MAGAEGHTAGLVSPARSPAPGGDMGYADAAHISWATNNSINGYAAAVGHDPPPVPLPPQSLLTEGYRYQSPGSHWHLGELSGPVLQKFLPVQVLQLSLKWPKPLRKFSPHLFTAPSRSIKKRLRRRELGGDGQESGGKGRTCAPAPPAAGANGPRPEPSAPGTSAGCACRNRRSGWPGPPGPRSG